MRYIINTKNINFSYGQRKALDDIDLSLKPGVYGLLGPNGAGKTTLMKILLGFLKPRTGSGRVLNFDIIREKKNIRRNIGYMPETECILPGVDGVSFVAYLGQLSGMPSKEAMKRAHDVLFYVGLEDERYRNVDSFSTGMKQRLKLAQAIVHDPKILFLDEPTTGMDPAGRKEILKLIKEISAESDTSIIFSTHLLPDVETTCQQVIMMNKGKILDISSLEDLKKKEIISYELQIKGNEEKFFRELEIKNISYQLMEKELYLITLPQKINSKVIFKIAFNSKTLIKHFKLSEVSLEEKFLSKIEEADGN